MQCNRRREKCYAMGDGITVENFGLNKILPNLQRLPTT